MRPADLLLRLHRAGIALRVRGDSLSPIGPKRALTPDLRAEVKACKPALLALLSGPVAPLPADCWQVAAGWPAAAHETACGLEEALAAAGADQAAARTFGAIEEAVAAWRQRRSLMPEGLAEAEAIAWRSAWEGQPEPEPADAGNPWFWCDAPGLKVARMALRRGLGLLA